MRAFVMAPTEPRPALPVEPAVGRSRTRRRLAWILLATVALLAVTLWLFRVELLVWRAAAGAPWAQRRLVAMGDGASAALHDAVRSHRGGARVELVRVLAKIRGGHVARALGTVEVARIQASLQPPDDQLRATLREAFHAERDPGVRIALLDATSEVDFGTRDRFLCDASEAPDLDASTRLALVRAWHSQTHAAGAHLTRQVLTRCAVPALLAMVTTLAATEAHDETASNTFLTALAALERLRADDPAIDRAIAELRGRAAHPTTRLALERFGAPP